MTIDKDQLRAALESKTPAARIRDHRAYWGDNPPPRIADMLETLERWLREGDGSVGLKGILNLEKLDHYRTVQEWETDPDTIVGEQRREQMREFGSRSNEEKRHAADERHARWLAADERLRREKPALKSKQDRARAIRRELNESATIDWIAKSLPKR